MSTKHKVSVVIIFLNGEKFIQEAIESVINQTYENWELLLVDDGSTDSSTVIAQQYAQCYPQKIRYLEHENHQNRGMRHAQGEYLAFLDADDVWLPQCLERLVAILNAHPEARMVYGDTLYWYSWTGNPEENQKDFCDNVAELTSKANTLFRPPELLTMFLQNGDAVPCICSLLVERELLEAIGGFEESFRGLYEDQVFYAKVCFNASVCVTSGILAKYRQHPDSCCAIVEKTNQQASGRLLFLNWIEKYLLERGNKNVELWNELQDHLFAYRHPILYDLKQRIRYKIYRTKQLIKDILSQIVSVTMQQQR